ncbi:TIR domain-containing protein [Halieaceae bacterium IMCC14734]|uniref:TIR domain-containing protein n=1 Tax=Candidatus Litorirhabdus singularis TaxID=2518993 RepID=A0ABT3TQ07_9GAMM|nr:TIR domain-containing protein [Candidatus Litorirhabdus singularis]MCX2983417.1 TIR domain-containing protein [Candidatus Litorirhabdus singularis]
MTDIFLSYAHEDRHRVEPLVDALSERGWDVWWDSQINAGSHFDIEIESVLDSARCVLVVWSKYSIGSQWVRSEAHEGMDRDILVPVLIDDVRPPMPFRQIQTKILFDKQAHGRLVDDDLVAGIERAFAGEQDYTPAIVSEPQPSFSPAGIIDNKPTIAVLPFRTISNGDEEAYLADGIAEDLIVNLSYSRLFPVISSATAFRFRDSEHGALEIGRKLGVKYLITGTVRKSADKVRITVELDDCESERQLWSDRYVVKADDLFELQEEMAETLIAKLDPAIKAEEMSRIRRAPPNSPVAWDHVLRGLWHYNKYIKAENDLAITEFEYK